MAISTAHPETRFGQIYAGLDRRLADQVCALSERLRGDGLVRANVDAAAVGAMFFNNLNMMFTVFVKDEGQSLADLKSAIARQNRTLAQAIRAA